MEVCTLATLAEARASTLANVAGSCTNSPEFLARLNEATRRWMRRGDYPGLLQPIHVCVRAGCVVFPRYVGEVRALNTCRQHVPIKNQWFNFLPADGIHWGPNNGYDRAGWGGSTWNSGNWWGNAPWGSWLGGAARMVQQAQTPVFQDIAGEGRLIRAYATYQNDLQKTVTIFGIDNNGQTLMHKNDDGNWVEGVVITLQAPFGSTSTFVRHVDRVLLDEMQGVVRLYAYDAANDVLEDVAMYEPGETNPSLTRYQLTGFCDRDCKVRSVVALIKLRFIPARFDTDLVLVENLDALKFTIQAIEFSEAGDFKNATAYMAMAKQEMDHDMDNQFPLNQISVELGELSCPGIGRQHAI